MTSEASVDLTGDNPRPRNGRRSLFAIRSLHIALWLLVLLGPAAAGFVFTRLGGLDSRLDAIQATVGAAQPASSSGAEGFAELFIAAYLVAGEDTADSLDAFITDISLVGIESGAWSSIRTTSLGAEEIADGQFAVTVAVDLSTGEEPSQTRFYSVDVAETGSGLVVLGLPSLIPAPPVPDAPGLNIDQLDDIDAEPGLEDMLLRFLSALLTGDGELARYTSPSSSVRPVQPRPFADVEILSSGGVLNPDQGQLVGVVVRATDDAGKAEILEYWLAVDQRDGRWEVADVLPAPPLAAVWTDQ